MCDKLKRIEAFRFGVDGYPDWFSTEIHAVYNPVQVDKSGDIVTELPIFCMVQNSEGAMRADIGDYIIRGLDGQIFPCKPSLFERVFELT